jgi:hypothetical protein
MRILFLLIPFVFSCSKSKDSSNSSTALQEQAEEIGESISAVDEMGGSNGSYSMTVPSKKFFPNPMFSFNLIPSAHAATCNLISSFGSCTNNVITRSFNNCTLGSAVYDGNITLTYNDTNVNNICLMAANSHSISRKPNFSITNGNYTYTVSTTGIDGQLLTRTAVATYDFTNDGIRRVVTNSSDEILYDFNTATTSAITVTGNNRDGRVIDGGTLRVTNNLTERICDYTPADVTYSASCNCAISGTWTGSCSDDLTTTLEITGCGTGTFSIGDQSSSVEFSRCYEM